MLRDSSFQDSGPSLLRGYLLAESTTIDGAGLSYSRQRYTQPTLIDGLTITNAPGPALSLQGWNFLLGTSNVLTGNTHPVNLLGGLLPGSVVPASGNTNNFVDANNGGLVGSSTWAKLEVPYVIDGVAQVGSSLRIMPGAQIQFTPGSGVLYFSNSNFRALGTASDPVRFERLGSGDWNTLKFSINDRAPRLDHCLLDGATFGINADNTIVNVTRSTIRNSSTGAIGTNFGTLRARRVSFEDNGTGIGATSTGSVDINGEKGSNVFSGNTFAVDGSNGLIDARNNYWGAASGPMTETNPSGTGDSVFGFVTVQPFETAPPTDQIPTVVLEALASPLNAGDRLFLKWHAQDDGAIASQRILFSEHGNFGYVQIAALSGQERSAEVTVPKSFPSSLNSPSYFKVVAVDNAGQEGFDEAFVGVPFTDDLAPATFAFTTDLSGPFVFGDEIQVAWTQTGMSGTWNLTVVADAEHDGVSFGGGTTLTDTWTVRMPYISTDTARVAVTFGIGAGGRNRTFYSNSFEIRPDVRIGDAAPSVTLTAPLSGANLIAGTVTRLNWIASDDTGLRAFDLEVSTDSGWSWQTIARDLPGSARSFDWNLPASSGFSSRLVRVIAHDQRFQNSSDSRDVSLSSGALALSTSSPSLSLSQGGTHELTIEAGPARAVHTDWILGSVTGPGPGIDFGNGVILPLVFDPYFLLTLNQPGIQAFDSYRGTLDGNGTATASLTISSNTDPTLAGVHIWHSAITSAAIGSVEFASNAVDLALLP